jgi:hypothetical protein
MARTMVGIEEAKSALWAWLHADHPPDECDGECVTTRRIFVEQACKVLDRLTSDTPPPQPHEGA